MASNKEARKETRTECAECGGRYTFPSPSNPRLCGLCEGAYALQHEWGRLD